jgi:hypothetical protein
MDRGSRGSEERRLRGRIGAYCLHARRDSRETTTAARRAFLTSFERQVDPTGQLPPEERARRAELVSSGETDEANLLLDAWLVVARSGFSSVHQIRAVTRRHDFVPEFLLPRLGEQELFGELADTLIRATPSPGAELPGIADLDTDPSDNRLGASYDLGALLKLVEAEDGTTVAIPGSNGAHVDADRVKAAIRLAIEGAVRDHRAEDRAEDALDAPVDALRKAGREIKRAMDAYTDLHGTKEFERQARGAFEYQFRHVRKNVKALEDLLGGKENAKGGR